MTKEEQDAGRGKGEQHINEEKTLQCNNQGYRTYERSVEGTINRLEASKSSEKGLTLLKDILLLSI